MLFRGPRAPLDLERLGATEEHPHAFEIARDDLFATELLVHLERLPGVEILAKLSYPVTDDCFAAFSYRGRVFEIDSPMARLQVSATRGCPLGVFEDVEEHVRNFRRVSLVAFFWRGFRYTFGLPSFPPEPDALPRA